MRVSDWMVTKVHTCRREDSLTDVARSLREMDCGCLPVVDRLGRVTGVITDRDICMVAGDTDSMLEGILVASFEAQAIVTCSPDDDETHVLELIRKHRVRRLPVVNAEGGLLGIVSLGDLASLAADERCAAELRVEPQQIVEVFAQLSRARYRTRYSDLRADRDDGRATGHHQPPLE